MVTVTGKALVLTVLYTVAGILQFGRCATLVEICHQCYEVNVCTSIYFTLLRQKFVWWPIKAPANHDGITKWKHFPRYWPFFAGNSLVTGEFPSQRKVTQSFDILFDLRLKKKDWVNNWDTGDLRHHHAQYDIIVMMHALCPIETNPIVSDLKRLSRVTNYTN